MKKILLSLSAILIAAMAINAQSVSVNTDGSTADASSILDVKSTTKGMLIPRMTTAQRTAIIAPANGLLVYDTDVKSFWYYNGSAWTNITGSGGSVGNFSLPYDGIVNTPGTAFRIANGTNAIEGSSTTGAGVYGYSENGSGVNASSANGFGILATSSQATAIRAFSSNTNPTIFATNSNATGVAISGSSSLHDAILGTSAGSGKAGVRGEATGTSGIGIFGTATATNGYGVRGINTLGTGVSGFSNSGYGINASSNTGVGLRTSSTSGNALEVFGKLKIYGASVNPQNGAVLTSDADGNATWKLNRVAFKASLIENNIKDETETAALFSIEEYDYSNSFNLQASSFTAPTTGVYNLGASMVFHYDSQVFDLNHAYCKIIISRGGNLITIDSPDAMVRKHELSCDATVSFSTDVKLQAGDVVWIRGWQSNGGGDEIFIWDGSFYGHLVFAE